MARIIFPDAKELKDLPAVQSRLAGIGITLHNWPAPAVAWRHRGRPCHRV